MPPPTIAAFSVALIWASASAAHAGPTRPTDNPDSLVIAADNNGERDYPTPTSNNSTITNDGDASAAPQKQWRVLTSDQTVRQALTRWAISAGWTFGADQWELPFDLPLTASAAFSADDFPAAALQVQDAVALTETPFRVCFYANQVLRVVPYNVACDRTAARSAR